jgi:DNA-binding MurR/RpiR family transcriptional regulator
MGKKPAKKNETTLVPEIVEPVLSRRHEAVIVALLSNPKIKDAAAAAGVNEATVWRLIQRQDFQQRYREAQAKVFDGALGTLQGVTTEAVAALQRNLSCGTPSAEVAAAKAILDFTMKARELLDLGDRVKELERKQALRGGFTGS